MKDSIQDRIYINPAIHFGKPCIKNTRIPIYAILELIAADISFDEIITKYYPDITKQDIGACIDYATALVKDEEIHLVKS